MSRNDPFEMAQPTTMEEVLRAREQRAATQRALLHQWKTPLICFTMNTPGQYKAFPLARRGYETGERALPGLRRYMEAGRSAEQAGMAALPHLIAHAEDTCMIARSSLTAVREIQCRVKAALQRCTDYAGLLAYARELNEQFIADNISPGGCADLLAAALMLLSVTDGLPGGSTS